MQRRVDEFQIREAHRDAEYVLEEGPGQSGLEDLFV